jgi:hypothetical protein
MNASLSALLVMLLLVGGWLVGRRRPRPFLRSTDTADVVSLNRAQVEQVERRRQAPDVPVQAGTPAPEVTSAARTPAASPACPADDPAPLPRQRSVLLRQLLRELSGSRAQRLRAIAIAHRMLHRDLLPVLHRGLRDPDLAVMAAAAAAMEGFRGRPTLSASATAGPTTRRHAVQLGAVAPTSRPRRVSRTR